MGGRQARWSLAGSAEKQGVIVAFGMAIVRSQAAFRINGVPSADASKPRLSSGGKRFSWRGNRGAINIAAPFFHP